MIHWGLAAILGGLTSQSTPQAEYEAYLAKFEKLSYITGAMMASGGPVGHPTVSTFRLWKGGMYAIFKANVEEHFDGKTLHVFSPEENKYILSKPGDGPFAIALGPAFAPAGAQTIQVEAVKDGVYDGREARIFSLKPRPNEAPAELYIRKDRKTPLAIVWYGRQAQYTVSFPELHLNRKLDVPFQPWSPPKGAAQAEFIRGG